MHCQPCAHQRLATSCHCDIYDVFLFVELPELQVFLIIISSTCAVEKTKTLVSLYTPFEEAAYATAKQHTAHAPAARSASV